MGIVGIITILGVGVAIGMYISSQIDRKLSEEKKTSTCSKGDDCCRNQTPPPEKCDNPSCCNDKPNPDS